MSQLGSLVTAATAETHHAVEFALDRDWDVPAGELNWSCRATAAHIADDLFSYASQVVAQPRAGYLPIEATMETGATPEALVESIVMCGELLRLAVADASADARAWHPYGTSDADGFAAMGIVEVLVHTHDITRGLAPDWEPPAALCAPVLGRLFPDAPDGDPSAVLLWCTGRTALHDRPRLEQWRWDSSVRPV